MQKVAVVSGASRGIGYDICVELAKQNFLVIGFCKNINENLIGKWQLSVGINSRLLAVDITHAEEVNQAISKLIEEFGVPSVLVNNAGVTADSFFHKMTLEQWSHVMNVNLNGLFNVTQPIYKAMREKNFGRIINISSVNADKGQAGQVNYCASKAGVQGFTKALALEAARTNITVNTISPGYINTEMTAIIRDDIKEQIIQSIPKKRFGNTHEIAKAVTYLTSKDSGYITGSNLAINGGLYLN